jgi:hypothetical protein
VRTKIVVLLSFLFLFSGALLADCFFVHADLDDRAEEEASAIDDFAISLRSSQSKRFQNPQLRTKLSVKAMRALRVRVKDVLSAGRLEKLFGFSQQDLYRLQEVYRL